MLHRARAPRAEGARVQLARRHDADARREAAPRVPARAPWQRGAARGARSPHGRGGGTAPRLAATRRALGALIVSALHDMRAPMLARLLITLLVPAERAELVIGDLEQDFAEAVERRGYVAARRDYWRAALRSALDGGRWHRVSPL